MMAVANDIYSQRRSWPALIAVATLISVIAAPGAWAASSGTLRIKGYVPARAWISIPYWHVSSLAPSLGARFSIKSNRLLLGDLAIFGNNKQFTVSLISRNSATTGKTELVNPETGAAVPYRLLYGGSELTFSDGVAKFADRPHGAPSDDAARPLELSVAASELGSGHFREDLLIVIKAR